MTAHSRNQPAANSAKGGCSYASLRNDSRESVPPGHQANAWWGAARTFGSVEVVLVDLSADRRRERSATRLLDASEQDRAARLVLPGAGREFVLCRAALRALLCSALACDNADLTFRTETHGKPYALVRGRVAPVSFNVSHSGDHGLIAIAPHGRVGVDIETHDWAFDLPARLLSVFSARERGDFAETRDDARWRLRFYRYWTLKESLIKGVGLGFAMNTARFDLPPALRRGEADGVFRFHHQPTANWHLATFGNRAFTAAVAIDLSGRGMSPNGTSPSLRTRRRRFSRLPAGPRDSGPAARRRLVRHSHPTSNP